MTPHGPIDVIPIGREAVVWPFRGRRSCVPAGERTGEPHAAPARRLSPPE